MVAAGPEQVGADDWVRTIDVVQRGRHAQTGQEVARRVQVQSSVRIPKWPPPKRESSVRSPANVIDGRCWNNNYYYINELELQTRRFLNEGGFSSFEFHRDLFRAALESAKEVQRSALLAMAKDSDIGGHAPTPASVSARPGLAFLKRSNTAWLGRP